MQATHVNKKREEKGEKKEQNMRKAATGLTLKMTEKVLDSRLLKPLRHGEQVE